jgi:hypothetical protein
MRWWLFVAVLGGMVAWAAAEKNNELRVRVNVPQGVAEQAARRVSGDTATPTPVLLLHGLEFGANEGFKIEVLAESQPGGSPVLLGSTAVVGRPQRTPEPPLQKIDLRVPLNDSAAPFLAKGSELSIVLHFQHIDPQRPPIRIESVSLQGSSK